MATEEEEVLVGGHSSDEIINTLQIQTAERVMKWRATDLRLPVQLLLLSGPLVVNSLGLRSALGGDSGPPASVCAPIETAIDIKQIY